MVVPLAADKSNPTGPSLSINFCIFSYFSFVIKLKQTRTLYYEKLNSVLPLSAIFLRRIFADLDPCAQCTLQWL